MNQECLKQWALKNKSTSLVFRIEVLPDGTEYVGAYRKRRGRWVRIPDRWVGQVPNPSTIRKRRSKKGQGRRFKRKCRGSFYRPML